MQPAPAPLAPTAGGGVKHSSVIYCIICNATGDERDPPSPDPAGLFSEGGEVMKLRIIGSITIPKPGIKRVELWEY